MARRRVPHALCLLFCLAGCATGEEEARRLAPEEPAEAAPPPTRLLPPRPQHLRFEKTRRDGETQAPETIAWAFTRAPEEEDRWRIEERPGPRRDLHLEKKTWKILREAVPERGLETRYDPALPLVPRGMEVNRPMTGEVAISVHELESGREKMNGTCRYRIEMLGPETLEWPGNGNTTTAWHLNTRLEFQMPVASATVTTDHHYVVGVGLVREEVKTVERRLGLFKTESGHRMIRLERDTQK